MNVEVRQKMIELTDIFSNAHRWILVSTYIEQLVEQAEEGDEASATLVAKFKEAHRLFTVIDKVTHDS